MILTGAIVLATMVASQSQFADPQPVNVAIYAIYATQENRPEPYYDPALAPVRHALSDLNFDTYKNIRSDVVSAPVNKETEFPVSDKYTMYVKPLGRQGNQARISVRVDIAPRSDQEKPRTAISTTVAMVPSNQVKLRGLKMNSGELVIVLALK